MKRLLMIFAFLFAFAANSQTKQNVVNSGDVTIRESVYNDWIQCEPDGNGKASFFVGVSATGEKAKDGYYYFDVFFFNNSRYKNGTECSTYIKEINFYVWENGKWVKVYHLPYALVKPATKEYDGMYHAVYIYNTIKIRGVRITWTEATTY